VDDRRPVRLDGRGGIRERGAWSDLPQEAHRHHVLQHKGMGRETAAGGQALEVWRVATEEHEPRLLAGLGASMKLEDLKPNASLRGVLPDRTVTVVSVQWFGTDALELTYTDPTGRVANVLLYRDDEPSPELVEYGRPWSFDGGGALFRLVSEAHRIQLAYLFDPLLAVHTSLLELLPHQSQQQVRQAEEQKRAADATVNARLPETFQWLLVPVQADPQGEVTWHEVRL